MNFIIKFCTDCIRHFQLKHSSSDARLHNSNLKYEQIKPDYYFCMNRITEQEQWETEYRKKKKSLYLTHISNAYNVSQKLLQQR